MSEIVIRFDLRFGKRWLRVATAGALMLSIVPELGSESVTLSTYYPAPSGVYTNMITTSNTYLARDGGSLGVGTSAPANKLHVVGNTTLGGTAAVGGNLTVNPGTVSITPASASVAVNIPNNNSIVVGNALLSSGNGGQYMHLSNSAWYNNSTGWNATAGSGVLLQFSGQTATMYVHNGGGSFTWATQVQSNTNFTTASPANDFNGHVIARAQNACGPGNVVDFLTTGTTGCPGGTYATFQSGVIVKYMMAPRYTDVSGNSASAWMLCCPCPSTGCPAL